ncbi:hypothetical protein B0I35DRAFT_42839 [Stachybotrys elegans]|uniref:Erythromycin esterase n=1 Tax=Stachybotrys elegans TaxID=80388 RepID=A0A8K0WX49_9HYPO|nr:hypothetical protein B0I35DRAFT_42839 [Stachybotrys elegans]
MAKPELSSVREAEETPSRRRQNADVTRSSPRDEPTTPASSAIKPPHSEMHPSKTHASVGAPSSGLWLGFADIKQARDATPSKHSAIPTSPFTFRVGPQAAEIELSGDAQRMMEELREQAAKIKADMVAKREAEGGSQDLHDRKFAKPKGKSGRFSAAHMAEFKKMDSIENHASAWRAQNGRFTPVKSLKRSLSKAELDGTPKSILKTSPSKTDLTSTPSSRPRASLKRTSSIANLDADPESPSPRKPTLSSSQARVSKMPHLADATEESARKRYRIRLEDDTSSTRPVSRDGSSIPQPKFNVAGPGQLSKSQSFARLTSPTKSSGAHSTETTKPASAFASPLPRLVKPTVSLVSSPPPKPDFGGLQSVAARAPATASKVADLKRRIISPGSFQKVKSILRGNKSSTEEGKSAIPQRAAQTPGSRATEKSLPLVPMTTPRRKLSKHVTFTPDTARAADVEDIQSTPSPRKPGIFKPQSSLSLNEAKLPTLDAVLAEARPDDVVYPDLSHLKRRTGISTEKPKGHEASVPGTFTFRSDHTIEFGAASPAFGASPGQSSIRHVRGSMSPSKAQMPGTFPEAAVISSHPNKENKSPAPTRLFGVPHGMSNKKRHRASEEEEEEDTSERYAKKRKNESVPDGQILLNARPIEVKAAVTAKTSKPGKVLTRTPNRNLARNARTPVRTPVRAPETTTPSKKKAVLSLSRLQALARPKNRG